jgi:uncharacterized membrane protein
MARSKQVRSSYLTTATGVYIVFALALGLAVPSIEKVLPPSWISPVSKSTIESILAAIAAGMITLSGLVFSLFFVLVQFGSATYSPRITPVFASSYTLRHSLGIFTGTFLFAIMALRDVGMIKSQTVSDVPVWMASIWLLASIVVLIRLIRVFASMTITNILSTLGRIAQRSIARSYGAYSPGKMAAAKVEPASIRERQGFSSREVVYRGEQAYITNIKKPLLVALARESDSVMVVPYAVGDAVKVGAPVALISGKNPAVKESRIFDAIELGYERALMHDPKYALRLLVDLGIRALSPGINDPTTAVQALDQIEPLLQLVGNSDLDVGESRDRDGVIRLVVKTPTWEDYLQLGLCEIMQYGAASIQIERRLEALLIYLVQSVPPRRAEVVRRFREQRRSVASVSFKDDIFGQWVDIADREGIGSAIGGE